MIRTTKDEKDGIVEAQYIASLQSSFFINKKTL